jgi:hypothetical protein
MPDAALLGAWAGVAERTVLTWPPDGDDDRPMGGGPAGGGGT